MPKRAVSQRAKARTSGRPAADLVENMGRRRRSHAEKMADLVELWNTTAPPYRRMGREPIGTPRRWEIEEEQQMRAPLNRARVRASQIRSPRGVLRAAAQHSGPPTAAEIAEANASRERGRGEAAMNPITGSPDTKVDIARLQDNGPVPRSQVPKRLPNGARLRSYSGAGAIYSDGSVISQNELRQRLKAPKPPQRRRSNEGFF